MMVKERNRALTGKPFKCLNKSANPSNISHVGSSHVFKKAIAPEGKNQGHPKVANPLSN